MARRWLVYLIVWRAAVTGCSAQCHTDSTRPQQLRAMPQFFQAIFYPKYPGKYPNNAGCKWNISADVNYVVLVHVKWMDLEESESCQFDNVTIYDYSSFYPAVVWCTKSDNNQNFYSSGPNVVATFTSDDSMTSAGFELDFKAVPKSQTPTKTSSLVWGRTTPLSLADSNNSGSGPWDRQHINTAALIGGLTAGLLLLFLVSALCRFYYKRSALTRRQPPRYNYNAQAQPIAQVTPIAQAPPYPPFSTVYQNNNNIFMMSYPTHIPALVPSAPHYSGGGVSNLAFSRDSEAPPAYYAYATHRGNHPEPSNRPGGGGADTIGLPPPPSYSDAMMLTHPPRMVSHPQTGSRHATHANGRLSLSDMAIAPPAVSHPRPGGSAPSPGPAYILGHAPPVYVSTAPHQTPSLPPVMASSAVGALPPLHWPLPPCQHDTAPPQSQTCEIPTVSA